MSAHCCPTCGQVIPNADERAAARVRPASLSVEDYRQLFAQNPDIITDDYARISRLMKMLRDKGVSIRALARLFGMSKSTLARHLPMYIAMAEATAVPNGPKASSEGPQNNGSAAVTVPNGTLARSG